VVSYCYHGDGSGEFIPDGDLPIANSSGDHEMLGEGKTSLPVWNAGIPQESFILLMNLWYLCVKGQRMIPLVYFLLPWYFSHA
jgi:hypothetical protein